MTHWSHDAVFAHVYPLGACGAPRVNEPGAPVEPRLERLHAFIPHWRSLGVNALYLGPLLESTAHGYDTVDYARVDRRLGDLATLARLVRALHDAGIRVILDGVFHHVGRDFWAFRDVLARGASSPHASWFAGLRFDRSSRRGDPFAYDCWSGCDDLVKLDLGNASVRAHLFSSVEGWIRGLDIDGLRLDVAECIELPFLEALAAFTRGLREDFWLLGEVIHGDYRRWARAGALDSTTNYEAYKGLYSSLNDANYFEIAHSLRRQFGDGGLYRGLPLYNFADNHDVDRVASSLRRPEHLYPLYLLLFTMPGVPSIYYGSEWGWTGRKAEGDGALRTPLPSTPEEGGPPHPDLATAIARLARARHACPALRHGTYRELYVAARQLAFAREVDGVTAIVALNSADEPATLALRLPELRGHSLVDLLAPGGALSVEEVAHLDVPPCWGRILVTQ